MNTASARQPPVAYTLRVAGRLDARWADWFDGFALTREPDGTTAITGAVSERALAAFPNVSVRVADAVATGLPADSADAVVAVNVLHIVPDAVAVLAEARSLLRPAGVLIIADATGEGMPIRQILISIWRGLRRWGLKTHQKGQRNLTQTTLEALVRAAGFASLEGQVLAGRAMNAAFVRAIKPAQQQHNG